MSIIQGQPMSQEKNYLFIDGGYLKKVIENHSRKMGFDSPLPFNWNFTGYKKIFYYDSPPSQKELTGEEYKETLEEHERFVSHLSSKNDFHVIQGDITGSGTRVRQKGVDVKLAVDMLTHAMRGNMTIGTLLTGDLDFKPVIESLVSLGLTTVIWSEKSGASKKLLLAADRRNEFTVEFLLNHLEEGLLLGGIILGFSKSGWNSSINCDWRCEDILHEGNIGSMYSYIVFKMSNGFGFVSSHKNRLDQYEYSQTTFYKYDKLQAYIKMTENIDLPEL